MTAELSLMRVLVEAHIATLPTKRALAYLNACVVILREREEETKVVSIRRRKNVIDPHLANRQALAAFRVILEGCVARLGENDDDI